MKKILVPTDLSQESTKVLAQVRQQCALYGNNVDLTLLYALPLPDPIEVFEVGVMLPDTSELSEQATKAANARLEEIKSEHLKDLNVTTLVRSTTGPAYQVIADVARERDVDLIVMSTHGRSGFSHFLLGSVAEKVLQTAPCPVLLIPLRTAEK